MENRPSCDKSYIIVIRCITAEQSNCKSMKSFDCKPGRVTLLRIEAFAPFSHARLAFASGNFGIVPGPIKTCSVDKCFAFIIRVSIFITSC